MSAEADERNAYGFPAPVEVTAHERANQTTNVDQSVNKALPYVAWSWLLSGLALGGLLGMPILMSAKVDAGKADVRAEVADQLAKAQAEMHMASTNALLAKDRTDKVAAELEARGLIKLENH